MSATVAVPDWLVWLFTTPWGATTLASMAYFAGVGVALHFARRAAADAAGDAVKRNLTIMTALYADVLEERFTPMVRQEVQRDVLARWPG